MNARTGRGSRSGRPVVIPLNPISRGVACRERACHARSPQLSLITAHPEGCPYTVASLSLPRPSPRLLSSLPLRRSAHGGSPASRTAQHPLVALHLRFARQIATAALPLTYRAAGPRAPAESCATATLAPKRHKRAHSAPQRQVVKLPLVPLLLQAVQHDGRVAERSVDQRWPRMVLHHEWRVHQRQCEIAC